MISISAKESLSLFEEDQRFESAFLHRRVGKLSVPLGDDALLAVRAPCPARTEPSASHRPIIRKLHGVGPAAARKMARLRIETGLDP